jgi:hypothetical protein
MRFPSLYPAPAEVFILLLRLLVRDEEVYLPQTIAAERRAHTRLSSYTSSSVPFF